MTFSWAHLTVGLKFIGFSQSKGIFVPRLKRWKYGCDPARLWEIAERFRFSSLYYGVFVRLSGKKKSPNPALVHSSAPQFTRSLTVGRRLSDSLDTPKTYNAGGIFASNSKENWTFDLSSGWRKGRNDRDEAKSSAPPRDRRGTYRTVPTYIRSVTAFDNKLTRLVTGNWNRCNRGKINFRNCGL